MSDLRFLVHDQCCNVAAADGEVAILDGLEFVVHERSESSTTIIATYEGAHVPVGRPWPGKVVDEIRRAKKLHDSNSVCISL